MPPLNETDLKAENVASEHWLSDGACLYFRIVPSDRRTWIWGKKRNGVTSYVTVGH
jgi:hypothetical protein